MKIHWRIGFARQTDKKDRPHLKSERLANRPAVIIVVLAAGPDGRPSQGGRKVRTPQSSVPDNVRDGGFKSAGRPVPQKTYRLCGNVEVRVKRCGKSAPPRQ